MTRPPDWSALGLGDDPTPGDQSQVQDVYSLLNTLAGDYQTILDTINTINGYADSANLTGATADALRHQMNGRITNFVKSAQTAFSQAAPVMSTYLGALKEHQQTADGLLTQAQNSGLKPDDDQVKSWATQAKQAGTDLQSASSTAAGAIRNLPGPSDPLSPWQEFLQILGWIALLLILPAMIFGGVIALVELVVNAVLFVNALIEFAQGNLSFGGLLLAALAIIAPTTRGISLGDVVDVLKGIGSSFKTGFVNIRSGLQDFIDILTTGGLTRLVSVDTLISIGNFVLKAGMWVFTGIKDLPSITITSAVSFAEKLGTLFESGAMKIVTNIRTGAFLSLVLPVDAVEVEKLGLAAALRLGFLDRGLGITASPEISLAQLNKLALKGLGTGTYHFDGFSYLDAPRINPANVAVKGFEANLPKTNLNLQPISLDLHLEAPTLSVNNLAASFQHGSLEIGTISARMPNTTVHLSGLDLPDLRMPKELNDIGNGSTVVHMTDLSLVVVRDDKLSVPPTDTSVASLHTANIPNLAATHLSADGLHTSVPNLAAPHLGADTLHANVPQIQIGDLTAAQVKSVDLTTAASSHLLTPHDMPSLGAIVNTKINTAVAHGLTIDHTDLGVKIDSTRQLAETARVDAFDHLAVPAPDTAAPHVNTPALDTPQVTTPHLATPQLTTPRVPEAHVQSVPVEIRTLQANPELGAAVTVTDTGIHVNTAFHPDATSATSATAADAGVHVDVGFHSDATTATDATDAGIHAEPHVAALPESVHVETTAETPHAASIPAPAIPAVSSHDAEQAAAYSAGAPGLRAEDPDLAGEPGLFDPNADRVAVAWTDFKQAQFEHGGALTRHDQQFSGADPDVGEASAVFHGKDPQTSAQISAVQDLEVAANMLNAAATKLHELGVDPLQLSLREHSELTAELNAAPKLLGGARPGDRPLAADPITGRPTLATRTLGPNHRLVITTADGHEFGEVRNVHTGETEFAGHLTELGEHAGFRLDAADGSTAFREYRPNGTVNVEGGAPLNIHPLGGGRQLVLHVGGDEVHADVVDVRTGEVEFGGRLTPIGDDGAFRIDAVDGSGGFRGYLADGTLHVEGRLVFDRNAGEMGEFGRYADGSVRFSRAGGEQVRDLEFSALPGGGVRLSESGGWRTWEFDAHGVVTVEPIRLTAGAGAGFAARSIHVDHLDSRAYTYRGDGGDGAGEVFSFTPAADGSGGFRLGPDEPGVGAGAGATSWVGYDVRGRVIGWSNPLRYLGGNVFGTLEIDLRGAGRATLVGEDGVRVPHVLGVHGETIQLTAADGSVLQVGARLDHTVLTHADLHVSLPGGGALDSVLVDYARGEAAFRAPGLGDRMWRFEHGDDAGGGGFTLTSVADDGAHVLHFNEDDELVAHDIQATDPATGGQLGIIRVLHEDDRAVFALDGLPDHIQWSFAPDADGGFRLTSLDGVHSLDFNPANALHAGHLTTRDPLSGELTDVHVSTDHLAVDPDTGAPAPTHTAVDGTGAGLGFRVTRTDAGHFVLTELHGGRPSFTEFDATTGAVRAERISLQGHNAQVDVDHLAPGGPAAHIHATPATAHLSVVRDGETGSLQVRGLSPAHPNDFKTFDARGVLTGERITITDAKGRPLPNDEHFAITGLGGPGPRWVRQDLDGQIRALLRHPDGTVHVDDARLDAGYNSAGAVTVKNDGTLVLEGEDKTAAFTREPLADGVSIEVIRIENGGRRWVTWDPRGNVTGSGIRRYSTEDGGVTFRDINGFGRTLRHYRVAADGGLIRAERINATELRWTRLTKDGTVTGLTGIRRRPMFGLFDDMFGWRDTFVRADGTTVDAQRGWSAWHVLSTDMHWRPFTHAGHYREAKIAPVPGSPGAFQIDKSVKELSPQGKDTGSVETLAGGHSIEFVRYAEQRVPDFLWKTPDNLPNGLSKVLAKSYLGSKWGAVDFPKHGIVFGDARFQTFKWVEKDAAGAVHSEGVRVVTPDGSFSDFAGDGVFVRGAIKLDNGHTVEIGRDPANPGKWDTFRLADDGTRPAPTLNWHQLDGDKNVVVSGTRAFEGKQWRDTFTDENGTFVLRRTNASGDVLHVDVNGRISVTRNTMGQIVERTDRWDQTEGALDVRITGRGDPVRGRWTWHDEGAGSGVRISGRNAPVTDSWDDSFADFHRTADGSHVQIRDFRALDKGTSLRAERGPDGAWSSGKYDFHGNPVAGTRATREWKDPNGVVYLPGPGIFKSPKLSVWRDLDGDGRVVRELVDGKVREYTDPAAHGDRVWKEYNFGSVWRERKPLGGQRNLFIEKESFQKQWRVTNANGELLRYRSITGDVLERDTFGRWKLVGTERETRGTFPALNVFRGVNRRLREPNRVQFSTADGAVAAVRGEWTKLGEKTVLDFLQDFAIDVGANVVITGATEGWNFDGDQIGTFFLGGAIRSGVKAGYGLLTETLLKSFRDGLRNLDGGKDFNRQPYNNDKHWDNEWAGNENPPRWRAGAFDFFVGNTAVPALGSFLATLVTGSTFGIGKDTVVLHDGELAAAAGLSMAGSAVGGLTVGAIKTLGHLGLSGRWFHQGGIGDIALQLGEKLAIDYLVNDILSGVTGLSAGHEAKIGLAGQDLGNSS